MNPVLKCKNNRKIKTKVFSVHLSFLFLLNFSFSIEQKKYSLPEIIEIGINNNPKILAQFQEVAAKKASFQSSKLLFNPEIEYHRGRGKSYETEQRVNTEGFSISQSLENPVKRKYRIQMFEKDWEAAQYNLSISKLEVIFKIKSHFYEILLLNNKEEIALKNLNSLKEIHALIKKRVQLGEVKELEAIKLYVEILKAQNDLNKVQTELKLAKENLNKFLGNSLPSDYSIRGNLNYVLLDKEEKSLINMALLSHPLIRKKWKEVELAQSNVNYVRWQRLPDPKLSGFINKEIDGKNKGIGISMNIPLWNFKSKEIAVAKSLAQKQEEELKSLKLEITTDIKTKFSQLKLSEQTIRLFLSGLLKEAEESLKIAEVSYKHGEISLIDYLDSQRTYYSILKDYNDSLYNWNANKASLEKSVGEELE